MDKKLFFNTTLPALPAAQIVENEYVEERFIDIFETIHGGTGLVIFEREKFYFQKIVSEDEKLKKCTQLSLFATFLDLATQGLTLAGGSKAQCYIQSRYSKANQGQVAYLQPSGYGELVKRIRANQVLFVDPPEACYEGEIYKQVNSPDGVSIYHEPKYPRGGWDKFLLIYVRIVRPDNSVTFSVLDKQRIMELQVYSEKQNGGEGKGNPNYYKKDMGFFKSKALLHSFNAFPKIKLSNFSAITDAPESPKELGIPQETYDEIIKEPSAEPEANKEPQPSETQPAEAQGVTIKDKNLEMF